MDEIFVTTNQTPIIYAGEQAQATPTDPNDPNAPIDKEKEEEEKPVKVKITHIKP